MVREGGRGVLIYAPDSKLREKRQQGGQAPRTTMERNYKLINNKAHCSGTPVKGDRFHKNHAEMRQHYTARS